MAGDGVNPLLALVFCPLCWFSGGAAVLSATLGALVPAGVPIEHVVGPLVAVGPFLAWLAWGRAQRSDDADACAC
jgi:hypothetical protein